MITSGILVVVVDVKFWFAVLLLSCVAVVVVSLGFLLSGCILSVLLEAIVLERSSIIIEFFREISLKVERVGMISLYYLYVVLGRSPLKGYGGRR